MTKRNNPYQNSSKDPIALIALAQALIQSGQEKQATLIYVRVAEIFLSRKDLKNATINWQHALELKSGLIVVRAKLAFVYKQLNLIDKAVKQFLILASQFYQMGDVEKAEGALERALELDAGNHEAIRLLDKFRIMQESAVGIDETIIRDNLFLMICKFYRNQETDVAVEYLDRLLSEFAKERNAPMMIRTLGDLAQLFPKEPSLHQRLASLYEKIGDKNKALNHLDILGDL